MLRKYAVLLAPDATSAVAAPTNPAPSTPAAPAAPAANAPDKPADPFADLAKGAFEGEKPKEPAKPEEKAKETPKEPAAPADKKVAAVKPKDAPAEPNLVRDLRKRGDDAVKKASELEARIQELTKNGANDSAVAKTLTERDNTIKELQTKLARYDYRQSQDFQDKYQKPIDNAAKRAKEVVESLNVALPRKEGEEPQFRRATWDDFRRLAGMDRHTARQQAKAMFGEDAGDVMNQYDSLRSLYEQGQQAADEHAANADKMTAEERSKEIQQRETVQKAFEIATKDLRDSNPDQFGDFPDDPELDALWKKSQELVDGAYFRREKMSQEELVVLDAAIRLRAARSPILERQNAKLKQEIEELRAQIEGGEESANGKTAKRGEAPKVTDDLEKQAMAAFG